MLHGVTVLSLIVRQILRQILGSGLRVLASVVCETTGRPLDPPGSTLILSLLDRGPITSMSTVHHGWPGYLAGCLMKPRLSCYGGPLSEARKVSTCRSANHQFCAGSGAMISARGFAHVALTGLQQLNDPFGDGRT